MSWQDETKTLINDLLEDMPCCMSEGRIGKIEEGTRINLQLGLETITKIQEHEAQIQELQAGDVSIPEKIWEGTWNSGTLTPSTDAGHIEGSGNLADYNSLIFVVAQDDTSDRNMGFMPQEMYSYFSSTSDIFKINVGDRFLSFHFSSAETLVFDARDKGDLIQIWGIK